MTSRIIAVEPFDLVVFGGTGDLAYRKLFPSLYLRDLDGQLTDPSRIVGVSRQALSAEMFRDKVAEALRRFVKPEKLTEPALARFLARLHYLRVDALGNDGWTDMKELLADGLDRVRAFYLATAPELFDPITHKLDARGLLTPKTRVVLEKPLGKDLGSARKINSAVGEVLDEARIYRIDHYLGKETVQNLLALRFSNSMLFEPAVEQADMIDHVQITVAETVGVEGRAAPISTRRGVRCATWCRTIMLQLLCLRGDGAAGPSTGGRRGPRRKAQGAAARCKPIDAVHDDQVMCRCGANMQSQARSTAERRCPATSPICRPTARRRPRARPKPSWH